MQNRERQYFFTEDMDLHFGRKESHRIFLKWKPQLRDTGPHFPPSLPEFVKMFTDLILNINKTCTLGCTARKHAQWSMHGRGSLMWELCSTNIMQNTECNWRSPRHRCICKHSSTRQMYHFTGLGQLKERESKAEETKPARTVLCWEPPRDGG